MNSRRRRFLIRTSGFLAPLALMPGAAIAGPIGDPNSAAAFTAVAAAPRILLVQAQDPVTQDASAEDSNASQAAESRPGPAATTAPATASSAPREPGAPAAPQAQSGPDEDADAEKAPADAPGSRASPQRFVPSEQVRADFDVSFPIDI